MGLFLLLGITVYWMIKTQKICIEIDYITDSKSNSWIERHLLRILSSTPKLTESKLGQRTFLQIKNISIKKD